ncbi:hypothetical protein [Pseudomonas sp. CHM02]|uniref:c-type cytochrome n=1 Tax=Pseudomonas sp. CHM02 TaxID=1463662 RepID=UPI0015A5C5C2|nr:hypothetical protein [Pseudomonas sp. CHM02]
MKLTKTAFYSLMLCSLANSSVADSIVNNLTIINSCINCHGITGSNSNEIPQFHQKNEEQLTQILMAYKSKNTKGTMMNRVMEQYSQQDIKAIAIIFS